MRAVRLIAALLLLALFVPVAPARGHAVLLISNPADGSIMTEIPEVMTFAFSEPLVAAASGLDLIDPDGERIATGLGTVSSTDPMSLELRLTDLPGLAFRPGVWTIVWRTLSTVDGHRWGGSIRVGVPDADGVVPGLEEGDLRGGGSESPRTPIALVAEAQTRLLISAGLIMALGLSLVAPLLIVPFARVSPRAVDLVAMGGLGLTVIGSWLVFPAIGVAHPTAGSIGAVAITGIGEAALLRWMGRVQVSRFAIAAAAGIGLLLWSNATHAAALGPTAVVALSVHLGSIAIWVSGVALFAYALYRGPRARALTLVLPKLSGLVLMVAPIVALSGLLLSSLLLHGLGGLLSVYGALIVLKVIAVGGAGLFGIRSLLDRRRAATTLTRNTTREGALMAAAAVIAAFIALTPTPTGGLSSALSPLPDAIDGVGQRLPIGVTVTPGRPGPNRFAVSGLPEGARGEILFTRIDDAGDLRLSVGAGTAIADVGVLPAGSRWTLTLVVRDAQGVPLDTRGFRLELGERRIAAGAGSVELPSMVALAMALFGFGALAISGRPGSRRLRLPSAIARRLRGRLETLTAVRSTRAAGATALGLATVTLIAEAFVR